MRIPRNLVRKLLMAAVDSAVLEMLVGANKSLNVFENVLDRCRAIEIEVCRIPSG